MKRKLMCGSVSFLLWLGMWAGFRPLPDYLVHGQEINRLWGLQTGLITGLVFSLIMAAILPYCKSTAQHVMNGGE